MVESKKAESPTTYTEPIAIRVRFDGPCGVCGEGIPKGDSALLLNKTLYHNECWKAFANREIGEVDGIPLKLDRINKTMEALDLWLDNKFDSDVILADRLKSIDEKLGRMVEKMTERNAMLKKSLEDNDGKVRQ